uniref:Lipocalin/cytosolic fatty-acid binding domain-containing protein n=1 Tax=Trichuris muris TaxID=70415 RepID=A0A5S6QR88_TRIMR
MPPLVAICLMSYLGVSQAVQHDSLFNRKTQSRPVVLRYKSDVSLTSDNGVETESPQDLHHQVSSETRAFLESTPASMGGKKHASHRFSPTADIQEIYRDKLAVKITPVQRAPKRIAGATAEPERKLDEVGLSNPSSTVIAKAPGLSSLLAEEEALIPAEAGSNLRSIGHNVVQKGSAIVSEIRSAIQPKAIAASSAQGSAAAVKPKVDVVGLTKQVLSPVLNKFLPSMQPRPSLEAAGADSLAQKSLLDILKGLGQRITGGAGFDHPVPAFAQGGGVRGPPVAGLPALPGLKSQSNVDIMGLLSSIGKRVMEKSNITSLMQPNALQRMADNLTDALVPNMPILDLELFMGRWFEGVNSPRASEDRCIVHHFGGLTENGKTATYTALKIYREGSDFGQVRYSIGYAFRGGRQPGMLQMHSSESSDPVPFWIYNVGPITNDTLGNNRYEYAVVSNWIRYPVTVLVRDPDTFKTKYEDEVLQWLEKNHFINGLVRAFNLVQPVSYDNCRYSENAFAILG